MCYSVCAKTSYEKIQDSLEEMSKAAQPAGGPVQERFRLAWGLPAVGLLLWAASDGPLSAVFFDRGLACFTCSSGLHLHHQL